MPDAVEQPTVPEEAIEAAASASAWDRAVEAAAKELRRDYATQYDDTNVNWQEFADLARATVAAALPVLLEELAGEVDALNFSGHPAQIRSKVLRIVRGFAAEVTQ